MSGWTAARLRVQVFNEHCEAAGNGHRGDQLEAQANVQPHEQEHQRAGRQYRCSDVGFFFVAHIILQ